MEIFELAEMAEVLGMPLTKARNWTIGRPLSIPASVRTATGTGSRNLYSIEDVYLMGLANEFSKAGFAAKAIGRLLEAVDAKRLAEMVRWSPGLRQTVKTLLAVRWKRIDRQDDFSAE